MRPSESILPRRDLARITVGQPYSILPSLIGEYWKAARRTPWGLSDYAYIYAKELFRLVFSPGAAFPVFALVCFGALLLKFDRQQPWRDPYLHLVFLATMYAAARTAALPGEPDRALAFPYVLIAIAFIHACVFIKTSDKPDLIQHSQ